MAMAFSVVAGTVIRVVAAAVLRGAVWKWSAQTCGCASNAPRIHSYHDDSVSVATHLGPSGRRSRRSRGQDTSSWEKELEEQEWKERVGGVRN